MAKVLHSRMGELEFHVPPRNQGQIVEVAYALFAEGNLVVKRVHDGSDGSATYYISPVCDDDDGDYWNGAPKNKDWQELPTD